MVIFCDCYTNRLPLLYASDTLGHMCYNDLRLQELWQFDRCPGAFRLLRGRGRSSVSTKVNQG